MKSIFSLIPLLVSTVLAAPASDLSARDSVTVHFKDTATTYYGENIYIVGGISELGNWQPSDGILLSPANYPEWDTYIDIPADTTFEYKFFRKQSDGSIIWEFDPNRQYTTGSSGTETIDTTFNGAAGTPNGEEPTDFVQGEFSLTATTYYGENIYLTGGIGALGAWDPSNAILMSSADYPVWKITVSLPADISFPFKFFRKGSDGSITWENDPNREATTPSSGTFFFSASFNGDGTTSAASTTASTITASTSSTSTSIVSASTTTSGSSVSGSTTTSGSATSGSTSSVSTTTTTTGTSISSTTSGATTASSTTTSATTVPTTMTSGSTTSTTTPATTAITSTTTSLVTTPTVTSTVTSVVTTTTIVTTPTVTSTVTSVVTTIATTPTVTSTVTTTPTTTTTTGTSIVTVTATV